LHALEGAEHEVAVRRARGRDAEAAVPHHDRGDAVPGRDGEHAVPEDLRVVVRVDVDEPGRDDGTVGVEDAGGGTLHRADRRAALFGPRAYGASFAGTRRPRLAIVRSARRWRRCSRLLERVPEVELAAARRVVDAGLALVLGREALALARVVGRAPVACGGGV